MLFYLNSYQMNYPSIDYMNRNKLTALLVCLALAGCVIPPAKDAAPVLSEPQRADFARTGLAQWPAAQWWQAFGDAQLDRLIERALMDSPSMAVAQARLQQAAAAAGQVAANGGVNLSANAQVSRQLYSSNYIYPPPLAGAYDTSGILELDFSYDFDFWGRNRSAFQAALGQRAAAQADADAAAASLSAAVAQTYFRWQTLNAHIALLQATEAQRGTLVELESRRVKAGVSAGDNLHPLTADVAAPHQTLVQLETQRDQALYQIKSLVGGRHELPALKPMALPQVSGDVPGDLHLNLLARRPDVAAARDRVEASLKSVDSARAAFYPDISISAFTGLNSLAMGALLHASSRDQGVTPAISLPIFDAGRLRANLNGNRADVALAVAQYEQTVQTAVSDVNDALVRLDGIARERRPLEQQTQSRQRDIDSVNQRLKAGLADRRELFRDQLTVLSLQDQEVTRHALALSAQIDLIKALGGGYGMSKPSAATPTQQ